MEKLICIKGVATYNNVIAMKGDIIEVVGKEENGEDYECNVVSGWRIADVANLEVQMFNLK